MFLQYLLLSELLLWLSEFLIELIPELTLNDLSDKERLYLGDYLGGGLLGGDLLGRGLLGEDLLGRRSLGDWKCLLESNSLGGWRGLLDANSLLGDRLFWGDFGLSIW